MGQRLDQRTALAAQPADGDLFHVVDISDNTDHANGSSKKITYANLIPDASTTVEGKVELATDAETITGTDTVRAVTPSNITGKIDTDGTLAGNLDTRIPSQKAVKTYGDRALNTTLNIHPLYAPQGFLINGKISVTDAAGITVAIKTLAGTDPSATDPVYCRIGDTVRTISAALSTSQADGTNYLNMGSAELATKEVDLFVYLIDYSNATGGSRVGIGFSRFPGGTRVDSFYNGSGLNEKAFCYDYDGVNAVPTSAGMELVGRFAATLSAGAGYTWSVPTYTAINLIQRPIYESRWLTWTPTFTGFSSNPTAGVYRYKVSLTTVVAAFFEGSNGTSNAAGFTETLPFTAAGIGAGGYFRVVNNSASADGGAVVAANSNSLTLLTAGGSTFVSSGGKRIQEGHMTYGI